MSHIRFRFLAGVVFALGALFAPNVAADDAKFGLRGGFYTKAEEPFLGAELLIRGSVTQFEPHCRGGSAIVVSGNVACLAINLRIVDAKTGRVVNATTVEGTSADNRVGFLWTRGTALPVGLGTYSNTPMETAIRNCIETAVQHIADTKL